MKNFGKVITLCSMILGALVHLEAADLSLPNAPLFVAEQNHTPLVMLVMGRDHTLYYEAYNDATNLDEEKGLDTHFKPSISYYGYFDAKKCYSNEDKSLFTPVKATDAQGRCGKPLWSGNFLNYLTTSRIDALRKVLYGGSRLDNTDVNTPTLVRSFIPQDAHSWGKTWDPTIMNTVENGNLKASDYGNLDDGYGYFFANTSLGYDKPPLLRVLKVSQNMRQIKPITFSSKVSSLYFKGTPNSGGLTPMSLVANNIWEAKINFTGALGQGFKFTTNSSLPGEYGAKSKKGQIDKNWDGITLVNNDPVDVPTSVSGEWYVTFNDDTKKFEIKKESSQASDSEEYATKLYIWNWLSKERPVAGDSMLNFSGGVESSGFLTDYQVKVRVCVAGLLESNCKLYDGHYLPTGMLQTKGEGDNPDMEFGLITGSYYNNIQGGVLRANIGKMKQEIDSLTGLFKSRSSGGGIIDTLDKLKITNFDYGSHSYDTNCGWITGSALTNRQCTSWGNPIGEMLFESMRYFAGAKKATDLFTVGSNDELGLVEEDWQDPFAETGRKWCDKPVNLIISDINTSYDSDQIPGSAFDAHDDATVDISVAEETKTISTNEGLNGKRFYIGDNQETSEKDTPTGKIIADLGHIRGLAPQEPSKKGSFYAAGVAYFGLTHDLNSAAIGDQNARTLAVALASPLPEIKLDMGGGKYITVIPYAKSVGGSGIDAGNEKFQPTNTIVDYYVEDWSSTGNEGSFRINFEDVEQGADHDMDMVVRYHFKVDGDSVTITLTSEYAYGGIDQHAGYVISGTKNDGLFLDVEDIKDGGGSRVVYYLDTASDTDSPYPNNARNNPNSPDKDKLLPITSRSRTFYVDRTANKEAASLLPSPLWYAAKWGSFSDGVNKRAKDGIPQKMEWDSDPEDGEPDNYFLVTNATNLEENLKGALDGVSEDDRSGTNASYTSSQITNDSVLYDSTFEAKHWSGNVVAYSMVDGKPSSKPKWDADEQLSKIDPVNRIIYTMENDSKVGSKRVFKAPNSVSALTDGESSGLSKAQIDLLLSDLPASFNTLDSIALPAAKLNYLQLLVNYLRGDRDNEDKRSLDAVLNGKSFRERDGVIGDIIHSTPVYGVSAGDKQPFIIFGANDGMVHVLNASTGDELFAYVPSTSYKNLYRLAQSNYGANHRFFVDGEIKIVSVPDNGVTRTIAIGTFGLGAQGAWALDLTNIKGLSATSTDAAKVLLWELNDTDSESAKRLGYIMSAPAITSFSGKWLAIFGNGYNNSETDGASDSQGIGGLLVVNVLTGEIEKTLLTGKGINQDPMTALKRPNALTEPVIADKDLDGVADTLYSGDLFGNVWKVDIAGKDISDWAFYSGSGSTPKPLFSAVSREGKSQPITHRPSVAYHPVEGLLVLVGTGKYIETTDVEVANQATQTVYGLWDKSDRTTDITRSTLLEQTITKEITATAPNYNQRETSKNLIDWSQHDGWYLDLYYNSKNSGERMNSKVVLRNTTAAFTTLIPNKDVCAAGGSGWYMEVGIYTGSNSYVDNDLVDHSAKLDKIPSEPVVTFTTDRNGDKVITNNVKIDGSTPYESPGNTVDTGAISWQMLY